MVNIVSQYVDKCVDFDDIRSMIFYYITDETGVGIGFAKDLVDKALRLRSAGKLAAVERNHSPISKTAEMLILADSFADYSRPKDKEAYLSLFAKAHGAAETSFDFQLLAGSLCAACGNIEDPSIDSEFVLTKELVKKAAELALEENSIGGIEDMAYMAKDRLGDKDLAKYIATLKKKLKNKS